MQMRMMVQVMVMMMMMQRMMKQMGGRIGCHRSDAICVVGIVGVRVAARLRAGRRCGRGALLMHIAAGI